MFWGEYQFDSRYGRQEGFLATLTAVLLLQMQKPNGRSCSMPQNAGRTYANIFFFSLNAKMCPLRMQKHAPHFCHLYLNS